MEKKVVCKDRQVNRVADGCVHVDTFITPKDKIFYVLHIDYRDSVSHAWIHQSMTFLESDISKVMCLLRKSAIAPVKSYASLVA